MTASDPAPLVGVDIGGTKIAAGVVDANGAVIDRAQMSTPRTGGVDVLAGVCELVAGLVDRHRGIAGIGVGAPGVIDPVAGRVLSATEVLPGWSGVAVADPLAAAFRVPVAVENDVRVAALGEATRGVGAAFGRLLVVSLGTGVGGALVFGGTVQRGTHGTTGEIAHLLAPGDGPIACGCGRFDHLESHCCGPAIAAAYRAARGGRAAIEGKEPVGGPEDAVAEAVSLPEVAQRAHAGDDVAQRVITDAGALAGHALAGLAVAVDVDAVVVTGGVSRIGDVLLVPLRTAFAASAIGAIKQVPVLAGALGGDAPLVGAAALARARIAAADPLIGDTSSPRRPS